MRFPPLHNALPLYLFEWKPWLHLVSGLERCGVYSRAATVLLLPSSSVASIQGQPLNWGAASIRACYSNSLVHWGPCQLALQTWPRG